MTRWCGAPTRLAPLPRSPAAQLAGSTLQLSWPAAPYRTYELYASDNLMTWQVLASGSISNYTENLDSGNASVRRLYRLTVALPESGIVAPRLTPTRSGQDLILGWTVVSGQVYERSRGGPAGPPTRQEGSTGRGPGGVHAAGEVMLNPAP
jgi:hypothetical protein